MQGFWVCLGARNGRPTIPHDRTSVLGLPEIRDLQAGIVSYKNLDLWLMFSILDFRLDFRPLGKPSIATTSQLGKFLVMASMRFIEGLECTQHHLVV